MGLLPEEELSSPGGSRRGGGGDDRGCPTPSGSGESPSGSGDSGRSTPRDQPQVGNATNTSIVSAADTRRVTTSYVSKRLGLNDGTTCLETFLARFNSCVRYVGWNEEDQRFNLSVSLEGAAGQILWDAGPQSTIAGDYLTSAKQIWERQPS